MDSKGNVFYTDLSHVWKIAPNDVRTIAIRDVHTHELYMDEGDNLYGEHEWYEGEVTDKWGNYVWRLGKNKLLEKTVPDVEGFLENTTLVRDNEGNSFWKQNSGDYESIKKTSIDGTSSLYTAHRFTNIRWMYFSKIDHNLYVVDHLEIKRVSPHGNVETIADRLKEPGPSFEGVADRHYIFGLWMDNNKYLYAAIYGARKVKKISPVGRITTVYQSNEGWSPCGGLVADDGTMWIMEFSDQNKTRVVRLTNDGKTTFFGE